MINIIKMRESYGSARERGADIYVGIDPLRRRQASHRHVSSIVRPREEQRHEHGGPF